MLTPARILLCGLVLLAGCSTASRRNDAKAVEDWEDVDIKPSPAPTYSIAPPLSPPETPTVVEPKIEKNWLSLRQWATEQKVNAPRYFMKGSVPTAAISTSKGEMILQVGSRIISWSGIDIHLGFVPQLTNNEVFVHALDADRNLFPLLTDFSATQSTNRSIVIDPGHGGVSSGTRSVVDGRHEKEFTLDWAMRLAPLLQNAGWQVFLTRTNDVDVSLSNRVAFAEERRADLFLSLHFNSSGGGTHQMGLETYCLTPAGMPSNLTRGFGDYLNVSFPNNTFDRENLLWAVRLHAALLKIPEAVDRGVRRARFMTVLQGQNRPAVLIEGGYLSNPAEARRIADPAYRQKLAEAVAAALQ